MPKTLLRSTGIIALVATASLFAAPAVHAQSEQQKLVAAGPVGAGAKSDIVSDLITFNRSKGVYGGLNFDGTVVTSADDWNAAYYGKKVLPPDILVRMDVSNKNAGKLLAQLTSAAGKK